MAGIDFKKFRSEQLAAGGKKLTPSAEERMQRQLHTLQGGGELKKHELEQLRRDFRQAGMSDAERRKFGL